eukprot:158021_1
MHEKKITNKDVFWNQNGFEIRNTNIELISLIAKHPLLLDISTLKQDNEQINSTILYRLVSELSLDDVLTQYVKVNDEKPIDHLMTQLKTHETKITNKAVFWNQNGFEIKNAHTELISLIAKHPLLLDISTLKQDNEQINSTILYRLVSELSLDDVLSQYVKVNDGKPIDHLMTRLKTHETKIS